MRKKAIIKEYNNLDVSGINNMKNVSNLLTSTLMDIEDNIIVYSENNTDTYDYIKQKSIKLIEIDKTQSDLDKNGLTKWIIEFDSKYLLREYLYNEIFTQNPYSLFKDFIKYNQYINISNLVYEYIDYNIINRYKLKDINFYASYFDLKLGTVPGSNNPEIPLLDKSPIYSYKAINSKQETISLKEYMDGVYDITYKQTQSSLYKTFLYYFQVNYEKI